MRIGELAALVGVTTRAVRHYHHVGLLPEPARGGNGYRTYNVRDAVLLARVRRLTELGLSLEEVRDVLADDAGRDLAEVLAEIDADLARQEAEIRERRRRLAHLLALDSPQPHDAASPLLAELIGTLPHTASPSAARDREHLELLDAAGAGEEAYAALRSLARNPAVLTLYERLDDLADADTDDPRVPALAEELVAAVPEEVLDALAPAGGGGQARGGRGVAEALLADWAPAQAEVVRRVMAAMTERGQR